MYKFIQSGIKHPGRIKEYAKEHGVSTPAGARMAAHSGDPSLAAAGRLAERFEHGDLHHGKKPHIAPRKRR